MQDGEISKQWSHAVAIWWSMAWRLGLGFFVVMFLIMTVVEFLAPYNIVIQTQAQNWSVIFVVPLGIWSAYAVLNKNFGNFRVAIVPVRKKSEKDTTHDDAAPQQKKWYKKHTKSVK